MEIRIRIVLIVLVALAAVAVWAFPVWYPYVRSTETIAEIFPGLDLNLQGTFSALPLEERELYMEMQDEDPLMALDMVRARLAPPAPIVQETPLADETSLATALLIRSGQFNEIDMLHEASGRVTIYEFPDQRRIMQFRDFAVINGPDLHVIFSTDPSPLSGAEVNLDYIDLGPLKSVSGNQDYELPASVDLNRYQSVVIYSVQYGVVFSTAALR